MEQIYLLDFIRENPWSSVFTLLFLGVLIRRCIRFKSLMYCILCVIFTFGLLGSIALFPVMILVDNHPVMYWIFLLVMSVVFSGILGSKITIRFGKNDNSSVSQRGLFNVIIE